MVGQVRQSRQAVPIGGGAAARVLRGAGSAWNRWRGLALHTRFAAAGSAVMLAGMLVTGSWVTRGIEHGATRNAAISTALYMESYISPISQELAARDAVSPATAERLGRLFATPPLSERIASVKIWKRDGLIAYATDPGLIGQRFEPTGPLERAWSGELSASFDDIDDPEAANERAADLPYLEVYNPIHSVGTGEIIAVAEFYQVATELEQDLFVARTISWLVVAGVALAMFLALLGIVRQGSRTIERQNAELTRRIAQVTRVSEQNAELHRRIQAASRRAGEHNERFLRRISAELHDGPAQALALASLRFDGAVRAAGPGGDVETIRASLDSAMREIRTICAGLSLPEIDGRSVHEALELAAETHERRTGTSVARRLAPGLGELRVDRATLSCAYRFVQEALTNAFRHAGGAGQALSAALHGTMLVVSVSDDGPGFDVAEIDRSTDRLGLRGLRERVESTGGGFRIESRPGGGTRLEIRLPVGE